MLQRVTLSLFFYSCIFVLTLGFIFVAPLAYLLLIVCFKYSFGEAVRLASWMYGRIWTKLLCLVVPVSVQGFSSPPSPCIITANHQSFFDPYCFGFWKHHNFVYVVRSWPFKIPVYGFCMKMAGYLNAEKLDSEALLKQASALLAQGISIIIFPEGTRSKNGTLQRFRTGAFKLALATQVPIIPVCIKGTGAFLPKGKCLLSKAPLTITVLPPVYPNDNALKNEQAVIPETALRRVVKKQMLAVLSVEQ